MRVRSKFTGLAVAVGLLAAPWLASAEEIMKPQGFPERPITMIVPYGAGGGSDQLSRAMAAAMGASSRVSWVMRSARLWPTSSSITM